MSCVVLFRIHTRPDIDEAEYLRTFERMLGQVSELPGFIGLEGYTGEDGSELAVATFDSDEAIRAWHQHPEHRTTQERGRTEFFDAYQITVASVTRSYGWSRPTEHRTRTTQGATS